jgi:hypothetical protein
MMRSLITTVTALAASLALVAPAHGQLTVTDDPREGKKSSDIKKVTTHHNLKRVKIKTRTYAKTKLPHEMWHLVDTHGDATPDFLVFVVIKNEVDPQPSVGVKRVDAWPKRKNPYRLLHSGEDVKCGLHKGRKRDRSKLLVVTAGRGCFKTDGAMPKRLRVSTFGTWEWGQITDVAPSWRSYGKWVKAG